MGPWFCKYSLLLGGIIEYVAEKCCLPHDSQETRRGKEKENGSEKEETDR